MDEIIKSLKNKEDSRLKKISFDIIFSDKYIGENQLEKDLSIFNKEKTVEDFYFLGKEESIYLLKNINSSDWQEIIDINLKN